MDFNFFYGGRQIARKVVSEFLFSAFFAGEGCLMIALAAD